MTSRNMKPLGTGLRPIPEPRKLRSGVGHGVSKGASTQGQKSPIGRPRTRASIPCELLGRVPSPRGAPSPTRNNPGPKASKGIHSPQPYLSPCLSTFELQTHRESALQTKSDHSMTAPWAGWRTGGIRLGAGPLCSGGGACGGQGGSRGWSPGRPGVIQGLQQRPRLAAPHICGWLWARPAGLGRGFGVEVWHFPPAMEK
jgi:hypothetical protein